MTIFKLPKWAESFADKGWNHFFVVILRILIGCVFIFSGFVKGVDPWGGYYKFVEYFNAFGFEGLLPLALFASFALAFIEFVLGVCVLVGAFRRGSIVLVLILVCAMLPLTFYLALTDRVPDCGCFGDAVTVSNLTSFFKNLLLLPAIVYLLFFNRRVHGVFGPAVNWLTGAIALIFIGAVGYNGYFKQPLIDFRPYPVGTKIGVPSAGNVSDADYVFVYERNGERQEFGIDNLPDEALGWNFVERRFKPGKEPASRTISRSVVILEGDEDVTEEVLPDTGRVLLFMVPDVKNVNPADFFTFNRLYDRATRQGIAVAAVAVHDSVAIAWWKDLAMPPYGIYTMDDSELKSLVRGNPALVMVDKGVVVWKRSLVMIDEELLNGDNLKIEWLNGDYDRAGTLAGWTTLFALALLALLVLNRTHVAVIAFYRLLRRKFAKAVASQSPD